MIFLTILLTVLKIIGLILAGLVGLVLILILWILFSPVRYKGRIKYSGKPDIKIKASYLCHIFSAYFIMDGDGRKADFKIFWKSMLNRKTVASGKKKSKKHSDETVKPDVTRPEATRTEAEQIKPEPLRITESAAKAQADIKAPEKTVTPESKVSEKKPEQKKSIFKKLKDVYNKIKDFFKGISDRVHSMAALRDKIFAEIDNADNREAVNYGLVLLKKVLKHILPRRHRIYIRFGTGDPASTGQYLGLMYAFAAWLGLNLVVTPDFEEKVFECDVPFKGHISIAVLLVWIIQAYRNKKFMAFIDKIRNR